MTPERRSELTLLRRARDLMDRRFAEPLDAPGAAIEQERRSGDRRGVRTVRRMTLSVRFVPIVVADPEASLAFYRDALGLTVLSDVPYGASRWITLGAADGSGAQIVLSDPRAGRSVEDAAALEELVVKGALGPFVFVTDDLDALFERAVAAGAEVTEEPKDQPWGPRDCAFRARPATRCASRSPDRRTAGLGGWTTPPCTSRRAPSSAAARPPSPISR